MWIYIASWILAGMAFTVLYFKKSRRISVIPGNSTLCFKKPGDGDMRDAPFGELLHKNGLYKAEKKVKK